MTTSFTSRQLATNYEILVARTEFLVALATRKAQFRTLNAWSAVNDVKRLQTGYIKNFRYLMTTGCGNTIVSRWRCHSRGRKHRDQAIKWIRSNSEIAIPPKRAQSPPKITKSRHSRKSYVLQDFRKLGMGIEIIVKGVFWSIVTIGFALGWRERNSSLFQCTRICYNWKQDRTQTWTSTV